MDNRKEMSPAMTGQLGNDAGQTKQVKNFILQDNRAS